MLKTVHESWGWTGLEPAEVVAVNEFGNVIVRAKDGALWRICPEDLSCTIVAPDATEFGRQWSSEEFQIDWQMTRLVEMAHRKLGLVSEDRCYCLKLPSVLGGAYDESNMGTISRRELIAFSGYVARQIKDLPDGAKIQFVFTE